MHSSAQRVKAMITGEREERGMAVRGWRKRGVVGVVSLLAGLAVCGVLCGAAFGLVPYRYEQVLSESLTEAMKQQLPRGYAFQPGGLAFDVSGGLFVADTGEGYPGVDEFDATGAFVTRVGLGSYGAFPEGVAAGGGAGHVYVAESKTEPGEVVALGAGGEVLSRWTGAGTPAKSFGRRKEGCCYLRDAVDDSSSVSRGDVYVMTTSEGGEVDVMEPQNGDREEARFVRRLEAPGGFSFGPTDAVAVNDSSGPEAGVVYVADPGHKVVDRFSATGVFEGARQLTGFSEPIGVAVDSATGDVFVIDKMRSGSEAEVVDRFSPAGVKLSEITETGAGKQPFKGLAGIAVQRAGVDAGDVYLAEVAGGSHVVEVFAPERPGAPRIVEEGPVNVSGDSATLQAEITPQGLPSTYHFEYGACATSFTCSTSPYEHTVPAPEGAFGGTEDFSFYSVGEHVHGLSPDTTYHFRLVARNADEATTGGEVMFTTQSVGGELLLPDGRQWELVSQPDKYGGDIEPIGALGVVEAADDGSAISYYANAPTEAEPEGSAGFVQVLSSRGVGGWSSRDTATAHQAATGNGGLGEGVENRFFAEDLSVALLQPHGRFNPALSGEASEQTPYLRTFGSCSSGCFKPLVTGKGGVANVSAGVQFGEEFRCEEANGHPGAVAVTCGPEALAATGDLHHVVLSSKAELMLGAGREQLYEWSEGTLQPVSVLPENGVGEEKPVAPGSAGIEGLNTRRAVSADGSRVFWGAGGALYVRDTVKHRTLELDTAETGCGACESGVGSFQVASIDGSRVFFTDQRRLTSDSGAGLENPRGAQNSDLYECRVEKHAGALSCGASGPVDLTPLVAGKSANVQNVLGSGEDGEDLYFVALGTLGTGPNARGQSAAAGQPNLFVHAGGTTRFIAALAKGDGYDWGSSEEQPTRVSPDGRWLSFMSERSLTGYDNRDAVSGRPDAEIYLYDASTGRLVCASCNPTGARPYGVEYFGGLRSDSGEHLLAGGSGQWAGQEWVAALPPVTAAYNQSLPAYQGRYLNDEGRLFFNSLDALVPQDVNGTSDVYEYEPLGVGGCTPSGSGFEVGNDGCVGMISSGASAQETAFMDASESGDDVFFLTTARLTTEDVDRSRDVYDAHACSSVSPCVPAPVVLPPSCVTEASCKASPSPQPAVFGAPASATFSGSGNPVFAAAPTSSAAELRSVKCRRGLVKRRGKCVKARRVSGRAKRAGNKRRGK